MAKGFEGLVNDAFADFYASLILRDRLRERTMAEFAGQSHPPTYNDIPKEYPDLELTPLAALLNAYDSAERHMFVHPMFRAFADLDNVIPIWHSQEVGKLAEEAYATAIKEAADYPEKLNALLSGMYGNYVNTSEPFLILCMLALANLREDSEILEIGSGCGYLLALAGRIATQGVVHGLEKNEALVRFSQQRLAAMVPKVTVQGDALNEKNEALVRFSQQRLAAMVANVTVQHGDALKEIPQGPYDAIIFSAGATTQVAESAAVHLKDRGRLIVPIRAETVKDEERGSCFLTVYAKNGGGYAVAKPPNANVRFTDIK